MAGCDSAYSLTLHILIMIETTPIKTCRSILSTFISCNLVVGLILEPFYDRVHFWMLKPELTQKIAPRKDKFSSKAHSFITNNYTLLELISAPRRLECFPSVSSVCASATSFSLSA